METIRFKLSLILTQENMNRIDFREKEGEIIIDVHGMKCCEAKRFINNIINISRREVKITVIHGYNHGTAIRDMIRNGYDNSHVKYVIPDKKNKGVTRILATA